MGGTVNPLLELKERLELYLKAEKDALTAQSTSNAEGELTQIANLKTIREAINDLTTKINEIENGEVNQSPITMFWSMRD